MKFFLAALAALLIAGSTACGSTTTIIREVPGPVRTVIKTVPGPAKTIVRTVLIHASTPTETPSNSQPSSLGTWNQQCADEYGAGFPYLVGGPGGHCEATP